MKTAAVLFARAVQAHVQRGDNPEILDKYDTLVCSVHCWHQIHDLLDADLILRLLPKCLLYVDHWGSDVFSTADWPYKPWQKRPGDLGLARVPFNPEKPVYAFPQSETYLTHFIREVAMTLMRGPTKHAGGVFLDDWGFHRRWWRPRADDPEGVQLRDQVWAFRDGHPGWRSGGDWNQSRMAFVERGVHAFLALHGKAVMANSGTRERLAVGKSRCFYEGVGPKDADWFDYWLQLEDIYHELNPGDVIWMQCLDADGIMHPGCADTWQDMKKLAHETGCSIGRSFYQTPSPDHNGGSKHSNTEDPTGVDWLLDLPGLDPQGGD